MQESNHLSGGSRPASLSSAQPATLPRATVAPATLPKPAVAPGHSAPHPGAPQHGAPHHGAPHNDIDLSPIALDTPATTTAPSGTVIKSVHAMGIQHSLADHEKEYKRTATMSGNGACHIKSFHCHLSDDGLRHLDTRINDWLDAHGQYEVKFVTSNIGLWDGKTKDPELIVNVWY